MNIYYVYRHIRLDTEVPFYVGKGSKKRAYSEKGRNNVWKKIVNKHGYRVEIVYDNLTEDDSFKKEIQLITLYKKFSLCLANMTLGGEGSSGFKHREESKLIMSQQRKGNKNNFYGKTHTPEVKEIIKLKRKDQVITQETRLNMSKATKGVNNPMYGKKHSEETKNKIRQKRLGKYTGENSPFYGVKKSKEHIEKVKLGLSLYHTKNISHNCKKVINTETNELFQSIKKAAESINISEKSLGSKLRGYRKNDTKLVLLEKRYICQ